MVKVSLAWRYSSRGTCVQHPVTVSSSAHTRLLLIYKRPVLSTASPWFCHTDGLDSHLLPVIQTGRCILTSFSSKLIIFRQNTKRHQLSTGLREQKPAFLTRSVLCVLQGAGAVICVWGSWRRRLRPTSPSLNLQSSSSWPFLLSQTTAPSAPAPSPSTDLLTETHSTSCARDPRRHAASTLERLSSSKPTFVVLSLKLSFVLDLNLLLFFIASAPSQLRDSSAGDKFASKTHTSTRQGHFWGIPLRRKPTQGPSDEP